MRREAQPAFVALLVGGTVDLRPYCNASTKGRWVAFFQAICRLVRPINQSRRFKIIRTVCGLGGASLVRWHDEGQLCGAHAALYLANHEIEPSCSKVLSRHRIQIEKLPFATALCRARHFVDTGIAQPLVTCLELTCVSCFFQGNTRRTCGEDQLAGLNDSMT